MSILDQIDGRIFFAASLIVPFLIWMFSGIADKQLENVEKQRWMIAGIVGGILFLTITILTII